MERDAVLPSSPPHATTDPSSSPFFEPHHHAYSLKSSSPPPLFSSDDSRESADLVNYESPRIFKNKRKGAWWSSPESAHGALQNKKAKLTRNFDSGVYMMSDSSNASSDSLLPSYKSPFGLDRTCDQDELPQLQISDQECTFLDRLHQGLDKNSQTYDFLGCDLQDADIEQIGMLASVIKTAPDPGRERPAESQYRSMVPELYINLSNNKLHHLTHALFDIQNLTTLVLVNNNIEELPACISQLRNLQELNISQNNITTLPFDFLEIYHSPNVGKLEIIGDSGVPWLQPKTPQRLAVLDPTFRQLRRDVFEIDHDPESDRDLSLTPQLQQLYAHAQTHSNPDMYTWYIRDCELVADFHSKRMPVATGHTFTQGGFFPHHPAITRTGIPGAPRRYMARTPITYYDQTGTLLKGSPRPPSSNNDEFAVITETMRGTHGVPATWFTPPESKATNSLLTMSLHSALRCKDQDDLTVDDLQHAIGELCPPAADALLRQAERNDRGGYGSFKNCNVCNKEYVIARAEWIEWWCAKPFVVLPFKVQVCAWTCVPDVMRRRPEKEMKWHAWEHRPTSPTARSPQQYR
jgi:hypothetical protein